MTSPEFSNKGLLPKFAAITVAAGSLLFGVKELNDLEDKQSQSTQKILELTTRLDEQDETLSYLQALSGITEEDLERRLSYPEITLPEDLVSPEIAKKHEDATMYIMSAPIEATDPATPLNFACTAVKVSETVLTSARHCYQGVADVPLANYGSGKGGYNPDENLPYLSPLRYFATKTPILTLGETQEKAAKIVGYGTDFMSGDSSLLEVAPEQNEWFSLIDPIPLSTTNTPQIGEAVHVTGFPSGSEQPVSANGVILGSVLSDVIYNTGYRSNLTVVGVIPESDEDLTCSFGASGSSFVTKDGKSNGALALLARSFTPSGSFNIESSSETMQNLEDNLRVRLAGTDFVICAYSPILPVEIKPLIPTPPANIDYINGK